MAGVTGIELGPNYCVLVRAGRLGTHRTVSAAAAITPAEWPADRRALVDRLREVRRRHDLPDRARVVAWDRDDTQSLLAEAGFEQATVLSPPQALARVVRSRQFEAVPGTAIAALSLNSHGAAMAIIAGTEVIHSRVFEWPLGTPFTGARCELLDRYLLVSQLAPQLEHAIELVRPVYGVDVTSIVACGNLPSLRSLAMLLIEEMDVEVETLDSSELFESSVPSATLADNVAALQLAAAVASPAENQVPVHVDAEPIPAASAILEPQAPDRGSRMARARTLASVTAIALITTTTWSLLQMAGSSPARPMFPNGVGVATTIAVSDQPELRPEATSGRDEPVAEAPAATEAAEPARARPAPAVHAPLPSVDGIMIAGSQRLAIVGGTVVSAGDTVGRREVARIERDGVVLRERSGKEIYVAIRPRRPPNLGS